MIADPDPQITVLDNGVRVVTDAMPYARSVSMGVWVGVGGRDEPDELSGASHFLEHLVFKGTDERSARSIAEEVDAVGGDINAFTTQEQTTFVAKVPASSWALGVDLLGDILTAPALRPHEIDGEREVILEELWASLDTPDDVVHTLSQAALFPGHPLGREVLGSPDTVRALGRAEIAGFFAEHYRPANLVVAAAGDVDHEAFCARVADHLRPEPGGVAPSRAASTEPPVPLTMVERDGEQVHLVLAWPGLAADDPDRYAYGLANQILGGNFSSRLWQSVREDAGLAYSVYSFTSSYSDGGMLGIYAGTSPGRSARLLDIVDAELDRLLADGVTSEEVRVAKGGVLGITELGMEDTMTRMSRVGRFLSSDLPLLSVDEQLERIQSVTIDQVDAVLRRVLGGPRSLAAVGPVDVPALEARVAG